MHVRDLFGFLLDLGRWLVSEESNPLAHPALDHDSMKTCEVAEVSRLRNRKKFSKFGLTDLAQEIWIIHVSKEMMYVQRNTHIAYLRKQLTWATHVPVPLTWFTHFHLDPMTRTHLPCQMERYVESVANQKLNHVPTKLLCHI